MDIDKLWKTVLERLKNNITSSVVFNIYIKDIVPINIENDVFTLSVSTNLNKNMIDNRFKKQIETILSNLSEKDIKINIVVSQNPHELKNKEIQINNVILNNNYGLNPKFTFENFIIGSSNEYATAASIRAAENPGNVYNPIFLYGDSGLGKTHLMQAIGNRVIKNFPDKKVLYVTSEKFMNEFIDNVLKKTPKNFRELYRSTDVLLIDDIQFLGKKESTQDELFHTFNELYSMNKQIVITSDRKPKELLSIDERLRTRFECGLTIDITAPSFETRVAILKNKAILKNAILDDTVIEYIADCIQSNVRELEGALLKIISYSQIKDEEITLKLAEECLKSFVNEKSGKISVDKIINKVCDYYDITHEEIISKSKTKNFTLPRQVAMFLCNKLTDLNYGAIAKNFGNRDRTTVMHNVEKIKDCMKIDKNLETDIECILKDIKNE